MSHVSTDCFAVERLQLIPNRYTLIQLADFGRSQQPLQVQLSDQDDLQQLFLVCLEIRQNSNLLEDRQREVLRFINYEHGVRFQRNQTEQQVVERFDQILFR